MCTATGASLLRSDEALSYSLIRMQTKGNWYFKIVFKNAKFYEPWLVNLLYNLTSKVYGLLSIYCMAGLSDFSESEEALEP